MRRDALGFSIGNKGYFGTGQNPTGTVNYNDLWEYDTSANTWTQKTSFTAGNIRNAAFGFSIGTKGYVTTGRNLSSEYNDVWEYDQTGNTWSKKNNFGGTVRSEVVGFVIGSKAFIGTGYDATGNLSDFWMYNPATDSWIPETSFPGGARQEGVAGSAGGKGYLGFGTIASLGAQNDWWEFDPTPPASKDNYEKLNFKLNPNPAQNTIRISFENTQNKDVSLYIYDLSGREVNSKKFSASIGSYQTFNLDISGIQNGMYYLKFLSGDICKIEKLEVVEGP